MPWRPRPCRGAAEQPAAAHGALTAELVETLSGAAELVAFGQEQERLEMREAGRGWFGPRAGPRSPTARRGLLLLVTGATVAGVLAVGVPHTRPDDSTGC